MRGHNCCDIWNTERANGTRRTSISSMLFNATEWLIPGLILAILPKCPLCIVAYVAIGTGIGLSVSTATSIRMFLIVACGGTLAYVTARFLYGVYRCNSKTRPAQSAVLRSGPSSSPK